MKTGTLALIVIVALVLVLGGCGCSSYNNLIRGDQSVKSSWSNVETNYQRRTDLYNSVVKTIQGSAAFEKSTLNEVIQARANATRVQVNLDNPQSLQQFEQAQNQLQGAFGRLLAVAENYPDLKANTEFHHLQETLTGLEESIQRARRYYNASARDLNNAVEVFPANLISGPFGFKRMSYFEVDETEKQNVKVQF